MLGVVPLLLVKDYLSIAYSNYFSVHPRPDPARRRVLHPERHRRPPAVGPGGARPRRTVRRLKSGRASVGAASLADVLEALARRLRGVGPNAAALPPPPSHPGANGVRSHAAAGGGMPAGRPERKRLP